MIAAIHQSYFLPWIGYFDKAAYTECFVILDHLPFSKLSFENRVYIKHKSGQKRWLSVPIVRNSGANTIRLAEIDYNTKWDSKICNILADSYSKAPYFDKFFPDIKKIIKSKEKFLFNLNLKLFVHILNALNISTEIIFSSECKIANLKKLTAHQLNMAILQKLNANHYYSGIKGKEYLNEGQFKSKNIALEYQNLNFIPYPQLQGNFIKGLSILDYIFNCDTSQFNQYLINRQNAKN